MRIAAVACLLTLVGAMPARAEPAEDDVAERFRELSASLHHVGGLPDRLDIRGGLERAEVGRVIRRHRNEMIYCYERYAGYGSALEGGVELRFVIGAEGAVTDAVIISSLGSVPMDGCLVGDVRRWSFPAPRGGGSVEAELHYRFAANDDDHGPSAPMLDATIRHSLRNCLLVGVWPPNLDRFILGVRLARDGSVERLRLVEPERGNDPFLQCVQEDSSRWEFPSDFPRDGTEVEIPLTFSVPSTRAFDFTVADPFLRGEMADCFHAAAEEIPHFGPDITVAVHVTPDGAVDAADILSSSTPFPSFEQCLLDSMRHWHATDGDQRGGQLLFRLNFWPDRLAPPPCCNEALAVDPDLLTIAFIAEAQHLTADKRSDASDAVELDLELRAIAAASGLTVPASWTHAGTRGL